MPRIVENIWDRKETVGISLEAKIVEVIHKICNKQNISKSQFIKKILLENKKVNEELNRFNNFLKEYNES